MAYDEELANRLHSLLLGSRDVESKRMFGGVGFLLNGNMCVGVWKDSLIARVGPDRYSQALREPFVREFDITGRPMTGWVLVDSEGIADDDLLQEWVQLAVAFVKTLPPKE